MAATCAVCTHAQAATLHAALLSGASATALARQYSLTRDQLTWCRRRHLTESPPPLRDHRLTARANRHTEHKDRARETFLRAYAACGNVSAAAKRAGINRTNIYVWQEHDAEFATAMRQADIQATELLEREAWRRAREGIAEPVYQHGKQVGTIQRYSDQLLMFLLRARAPERYRDRVDVSVTPVIKAVAGFDPADVI
jgi:transposase-like protein